MMMLILSDDSVYSFVAVSCSVMCLPSCDCCVAFVTMTNDDVASLKTQLL